jgi:hypothetical protein
MNTKYGKLVDGKLVHAPAALETEDGIKVNPSKASYLAAGWKRIVDNPPAVDEGSRLEISGWKETADTLTCVYKAVAGSAPPSGTRIFSKLKLVAALKAADKWVLVKTWMEEKSYYDYYVAAQDFAENNELFIAARAALQRYTGMTDADVEKLLAKCVADE